MKLDCNSSKWIPPTQSCHIRSLLSTVPPPIRVYGVNNKSCVTSQITQTAYHLFIVVYHNNSSVRTKATTSQTQAFVNELGRLPDLKINWQCCWFLSPHVNRSSFFFSPCLPARDKNRDRQLWESKENKVFSFVCDGLLHFCLSSAYHCSPYFFRKRQLIEGKVSTMDGRPSHAEPLSSAPSFQEIDKSF